MVPDKVLLNEFILPHTTIQCHPGIVFGQMSHKTAAGNPP